MYRQPVKSSNVKSVGYDELKKILEVEFMNGDVYQYLDVPGNVWVIFITSKSIGKAVHEMLRNKYETKKV